MKRITLTICTIMLLLSCSDEKTAEETKVKTTVPEKKPEVAKPMDAAAMEKAMKDFYTPGAMHKWLASFNGTWEADIIGYMNPEHPDTSKATEVYSMILNGLYQEGKLNGNMMGMPFEGRSLSGFDNARKKFVTTWVDNISSGTTYMTGDYDETSKTLNMKGTQTNPESGADMGIRQVLKLIDNDTYTLTMYGDGPDGKEIKFMEGTFKRKK